MPNYNITVVVDPSGAASGVSVVESNLDRLPKKAKAVETAVQRAFDFNTGPAVAGTSAVDKALDNVKSSAGEAGAAVEGGMSKAAAAAARAKGRMVQSQAQVRASTLQMGQQFNDFSTQVLAGGSVVTAFAQQSGQAAFALQGMNGTLGTVGRFLAGPWGTIIIIATTILAGFVAEALKSNDALDEAVDKLKKDARETEIARQAKAIFAQTMEGVTDALQRNRDALDKLSEAGKTAARQALENAIAANIRLQTIRNETEALIEQAKSIAAIQKLREGNTAVDAIHAIEEARLTSESEKRVADLQAGLAKTDAAISESQRQINEALGHRVVELSEQQATALGRIQAKYEGQNGLIEQARRSASAEETRNGALARQIVLLKQRQAAEEDAARDAERKAPSDGVARFRTRESAIGIAGREFQRQGLDVSGNTQFRVTGGHANNADHNRYKIDVDVPGASDSAVTAPDIRSKYDAIARRYAARGYRVLWAGTVYNPDGSTGTITGKNKHYGHMDLEAPQTIVGKATQASSESQAISEAKAAQTKAEAEQDFITGVVDAAAQRGRSGIVDTTDARVERLAADFKRRFDRAMTGPEREKIAGALTEAVARETAAHFDDAYVQPLKRLEALQGKTGLDREVLNAQLAETARLGRELLPIEKQQIENGIRQSDALTLQAQILEQIKQPQQDYADHIKALNALLEQGTINQTSYNARVADLGQSARDALSDLPGKDPLSGQSYSDIAARGEEEARYAKELETYQNNRAQLLAMGISYDALEAAAKRRHILNMNNIDRERRSVALLAASDTFSSLADIARNSLGEQSAVYKAMFTVSKAFAIADSIVKIQQGIANALSLPFPANIGAAAAVAAEAASIIANIQAISLNFANGGYVSGAGTSRSDSIPANLSNGEYVVNAQSTRANRALLEAINSGRRPVIAANDTSPSGGQGGDGITINVGDVIVQGGQGDGREIGRSVKTAIVGIVRQELATQKRSGGALTKGAASVMTGG